MPTKDIRGIVKNRLGKLKGKPHDAESVAEVTGMLSQDGGAEVTGMLSQDGGEMLFNIGSILLKNSGWRPLGPSARKLRICRAPTLNHSCALGLDPESIFHRFLRQRVFQQYLPRAEVCRLRLVVGFAPSSAFALLDAALQTGRSVRKGLRLLEALLELPEVGGL